MKEYVVEGLPMPEGISVTDEYIELTVDGKRIKYQRGPVTITDDGKARFNGIVKVTFDGKTIDQLLTEQLNSLNEKNKELLKEIVALKKVIREEAYLQGYLGKCDYVDIVSNDGTVLFEDLKDIDIGPLN